MTQSPLLLLRGIGKPVGPFALGSHLVLPPQVQGGHSNDDEENTGPAKVDPMSLDVSRRVLGPVGPRGDNGTDISLANGVGTHDGPYARACRVAHHPGEEDRGAREGRSGGEEEGKVAYRCGGNQGE